MAVYINQDDYVIRNDDGLIYYDNIDPPEFTYIIGAYKQGGIIGYIFNSSDYGYKSNYISGIIVSTGDTTLNGNFSGSFNIVITGTSSEIGYGLINSNIIKSLSSPTAILLATGYTHDGYNDWFLGSRYDYAALCQNKSYIPNFTLSWTSTYNYLNYYFKFSTNPGFFCNPYSSFCSYSDKIRPIRYFSIHK